MAVYDDSIGLENVMLKAQLCGLRRGKKATSPFNDSPAPEPMQMDQYHLSTDKHQRRLQQRLCVYCGEQDHLLQTCPVRPACTAVSTVYLKSVITNLRYHDAMLIHAFRSYPVKVLFWLFWEFHLLTYPVQYITLYVTRSPPFKVNRWATDW